MSWCAYSFHRSKAIWGPDADEFVPERGTPEERAAHARRFDFAPFHAGPRICLGQNMAYTEAKVALVRILQRFRLRHDPTHTPIKMDDLVMSSATGLRVYVGRRA